MRNIASIVATSILWSLAAACGTAAEDAEGTGDLAAAIVSYQAESAVLGAGSVSSSSPGFTGTGYATFSASSSAYVEWTVSAPTAKTYSVVIRFANGSGSSVTGKLNANGGSSTSFSLGTTASWSTWTTKAVNVRLEAGTNRVRLAAGSSRGLPYVDRLDVNDGGAVTSYTLAIAVSGNGSTNPPVGSHSYAAGTVVTVTATPATGATFTGWSGAATGTANPITVTMDAAKTLTASFSGGGTTYTLTIS